MKGLWFVKKCVNSAEMYLILIEKHQMDGYSVLCSALYHVSRVSNNIVCIIFILYFIFNLFSMVAAPSAPSRQGTQNRDLNFTFYLPIISRQGNIKMLKF